ncbi:DUF1566 domain-containing protein [Poseidonibacter lekithochrous]|uniref:Lcl C-terminal domain-containing protein n=1 Tax=Poseidonibacter TaxID=2321187 RepID=UPI001C0A519B|nr:MULTISPECIES: DUF1566 domain-containing protein [Poseidonibacter]MBU3014497.1 DUF1566 domain-containing protein [Poseidonibacter lekithochrous]MDO6827795.1 DUF1566 domain-containing protein [Poseidonibacter sp. 1_MG-2023]
MKYLILFLIFVSLLDAQIYRKSSQVVVDTKEMLMWADDISVIKVMKTHDDAISYCEALVFSGYSDWRIPKIEEFKTIVDKKNFKNYINKAFRYNVPDGYWAERSHWRTLWFYADYMHFVSGTAYFDSRHKNKYVRCVRKI